MKTAISIPDDVFEQAERFARRKKISRSALFTAAVEEYVRQEYYKDVTQRLNEVYTDEDSSLDPVLAALQHDALAKEDW